MERPTDERDFQVTCEPGDGGTRVRVGGHLRFTAVAAEWESIRERVTSEAAGGRVVVDLSEVEFIDGGTTALLLQLEERLRSDGATVDHEGANETARALRDLYDTEPKPDLQATACAESTVVQVGRVTRRVLREFQLGLAFVGSSVIALAQTARSPTTLNWRSVPSLMERNGADALTICCLINFLIGFILAFQASVQLHQFGADIYVADLVGLSLAREMSPLMTAIIFCGRSGAAFTASIGSMKVSEEIDAMHVLGIDPMRYLILPRVLSLVVVLPALALIGLCVGIYGGLLVSTLTLDITTAGYLRQTMNALSPWDVGSGLLKCVFFAAAIGAIACQQGVATSGGAVGVGRRTTSTVVISLFTLIVLDAVFTLVFYALGV